MRSGVVISHCPRRGEEAKKPCPAIRLPAAVVDDFGPNILARMQTLARFRITAHQQRDTSCNQNTDMDENISLGNFLEHAGVQGVENGVEQSRSGHDADGLPIRGYVALEIMRHRYGAQEELCAAVLGGGGAGDLAKKVEPAYKPGHLGDPFFGDQVLAGEVDAAACWVCRY